MQTSMNVDKWPTYQPSITGNITSATFTSSRIPIPYEDHQIAMIDNPVTGSEIGIIRTIIKWQAMNVLTAIQQAVIFVKSFRSREYLCILGTRKHHLYMNP